MGKGENLPGAKQLGIQPFPCAVASLSYSTPFSLFNSHYFKEDLEAGPACPALGIISPSPLAN